MRRPTCLLLLALYFWSVGISIAQEPPLFKYFGVADGLSNNHILALHQDHKGFIWIGTINGLNRYDGYQVTIFKEDPNTAGGLTGNYIRCLFEDSKNRLWVGTDKGVNILRPESLDFEPVPLSQDSTLVYEVLRIEEDQQGKIWLATQSNGIVRLGPEDVNGKWPAKQFLHEEGNKNSLITNRIVDIVMNPPNSPLENSNADDLLIFTVLGLHRLHTPTETLEQIPQDSELELWNSYEVEVSKLLRLGRNQGISVDSLMKFSLKVLGPNAVLEHNADIAPKIKHGPGPYPQFITESSITRNGTFWIAGFHGLHTLDIIRGTTAFYGHDSYQKGSLSSDAISRFLIDKDDNLWIGTRQGGINLVTSNRSPFDHYFHEPFNIQSISDDDVEAIMMDDQRNLWIRSHNQQMDKLEYDGSKGWIKTKSLDWSINNGLKTRNGKFFLASLDKGLIEYDPLTDEITRFRALPRDSVYPVYHFATMCEDQQGDIWMSTSGRPGVFKWDRSMEKLVNLENDPIWAQSIGTKSVTHIFEDSQAHLWFSSEKGVFVFNRNGDSINSFVHDPANFQSISGAKVWSVAEDRQGFIWISTNYGLNRYDPKLRKIQHFYESDGLPNSLVYGVLEDDMGYIWVSTGGGLARSNLRSNEDVLNYSGPTFRNFEGESGPVEEGFSDDTFWKDDKSGQLFFGGPNGLNIVYPERIVIDTMQPDLWISSLSIDGQDDKNESVLINHFLAGKDQILLSHRDDVLTFSITDHNFQGFDYNQFEYQLLGLSTRWIPLGPDKKITFIDLEPGNYTLNVKGLKPDGRIIKPQRLLAIRVAPPWWRSNLAYLGYLLLFAGIAFLLYKFQLNRQLERRESRRLKELDQFKSRLYTNITHEFRTPLTVILGMAEQIDAEKGTLPPNRNKISLIRRNGRNLLSLVNQMLDLSKLESNEVSLAYIHGDISQFIRYVVESFQSLANARNLIVQVRNREGEIMMDFDPERMRQIISNLLSNAIKYSPSGSHILVDIQINQQTNGLLMKVSDQGPGIPSEAQAKIFDRFFQADDDLAKAGGTGIGLALTKELVKLLGGDIYVESEVGKGSVFSVQLPIRKEAREGPETDWENAFEIESSPMIQPIIGKSTNGVEAKDLPQLLIIEDNPDVVEYLSSCLKEFYILDYAYNGEAGIEKALEKVPDIIISDVMMPGKDGFEVCDVLKNDPGSSHIPIVLLTAKADIDSRIAGLKRGADAYLQKPFHRQELLTILENLLALRAKLQTQYANMEFVSVPKEVAPKLQEGTAMENEFLQQVRSAVEENLSNSNFSMNAMEQELGLSRSQLFRKIKALTGKSPSSFVRSIRLINARQLLESTDKNVSEIAYEVGFSTPAYFSTAFLEEFGIQPGKLKRKQDN